MSLNGIVIEYLVKEKILVSRFSGVVNTEKIQSFLARLFEYEQQYKAEFNRFIDFSGVENAELNFHSINNIARQRKEFELPASLVVKAALLGTTDVQFGLIRMYQSVLDVPQIDLQGFRTYAECAEFLDISERVINPNRE